MSKVGDGSRKTYSDSIKVIILVLLSIFATKKLFPLDIKLTNVDKHANSLISVFKSNLQLLLYNQMNQGDS